MSKLLINDSIELDGKFTIEQEANKSVKPVIIYKRGILEINSYIEDIYKLENDKYVVTGIDVYREIFASEENSIGYEFTYKDYKRKE